MRKKLTMLFASLFLVLGTAWADYRQEYATGAAFWSNLTQSEYPDGVNDVLSDHATDGKTHEVWGATTAINVPADGDVTVTFQYVNWSANHAMKILGVDIVKDGTVVASEYHLGSAGDTPADNAYTLSGVPVGDYTIRYFVCNRTDGDHKLTNTAGVITVAGANLLPLTTLDVTKAYRIKSGHANTYLEVVNFSQNSVDGNLKFKNKSDNTTGQFFGFEDAGNSKYHLKSLKEGTEYYITATDWNFVTKTTATAEGFSVYNAGVGLYSFVQTYGVSQWGAAHGYLGLADGAEVGKNIYSNQAYTSLYGISWALEEVDCAAEYSALLAQAKTLSSNAFLEGTSELTALNAAIGAADALGNNPGGWDMLVTIDKVKPVVAAADLYVQLKKVSYITALNFTENSNHPVIVNNKRSNWGVAEITTGLNTLVKLGLTKSETDAKQQFAFITPDGGQNYYLYSIHAQRYLKSDNTFATQGEPVAFADASSEGDNRVQVRFKDYTDRYINVGSDNDLLIDWWSDIDEGNACEIVQYNALEFDLAYALRVFNEGADLTIKYMYGGELKRTEKVFKWKNEEFTLSSPWTYTSIESCTVGGNAISAAGDTWKFTVSGDAEVVVNLAPSTPFTISADFNSAAWHVMRIRPVRNGKEEFNWISKGESAPYTFSSQRPITDAGLWAFVGNPIDGFKIYNKAAGSTMTLGVDGSNVVVKEGDKTWTVGKCMEGGTTLRGFYLYEGTNNKYVHDMVGKFQIWNDSSAPTDGGSALVAYHPLTVKYMFEGEEVKELKVDTYVTPGSVYTIENSDAHEGKVIASCKIGENEMEAVGGAYAVTVNAATEVVVTLESTAEPTNLYALKSVPLDTDEDKNKVGDTYLNFTPITTQSTTTQASFQNTPSYLYITPENEAYFLQSLENEKIFIGSAHDWLVTTEKAYWNISEPDGNRYVTISRKAEPLKQLGHNDKTTANTGIFTNVENKNDKVCNKWQLIPAYPITIIYKNSNDAVLETVKAGVFVGESYTIDTKDQTVVSCVTNKGEVVLTDGVYTIPAVNGATTVTVTFAEVDKYMGSKPTITDDEISTLKNHGQYLTNLKLGDTSILSGASEPSSASDMYVQILGKSVNLFQGTEYTFTLTFPKNQTSQALVARVWMDKDGDGTYESLLSTTGVAEKYTDLTTVKFAVPYDATPGVTRIRLRLDGAWAISQTANGATKRMVYDIEVNVVEAPKTEITYNLIYKGQTIATENIRAIIGANFPVPTTAFKIDTQYLSFALPEGTVGENPATYDVEVTIIAKGFPIPTTITDGEFADNTQWYLATLRKKYIKYNGSTEVVTTTDKVFSDAHLFALTGDPVNGFQFYNKALGAGKAIYSNNPVNLDNNNPTPVELTTTPDGTWSVTSNSHGGFSFVIENNSTNYYLHEKLTKLSFWQSSNAKTDEGSSLIFKEAYDFTFFITGVPEGEDAGATFSGNSIVNGAKVVETEYVSKDLFDANDIEGYSWSITVDKNAKAITLAYQQAVVTENPEAVVALVNRIGGAGTADKFKFVLDPSINSKQETFVLGNEEGKILIKGSTLSAITTGLGWYLNNIAHVNIAWNSLNEKTVSGAAYADLSNLPLPSQTETHTSDAKYRYYLNYCTFGYSMTSWTWKRWQQEIDWMALHGVNMPLQIIGLEEVWRKFLTLEENGQRKYNYSDSEAKAFVAGPAFTAWWGMNNLEGWGGTSADGWGGVQDDAWYERQQTLATQILTLQRALGMQPVLPGFSGMVPSNFKDKTGVECNAGSWGGFTRPKIVLPSNARFAEIAADYYTCLKEVMGESQYYSMDPFHEGDEANASKEAYTAIYNAMETSKSGSQWVIQQWQWYGGNQTYSLQGVPAGKLIVLDLFSDGRPEFDKYGYNGYAPQEAVFCAIPNFGGRSGLMGRLQNVTDNYFKYKKQFTTIKGIGAAPEAIEQTPVAYDLLYQLPWMNGVKPDVAEWVDNYAVARYGKDNSVVKEAWSLLRQGPLGYGADAIQGPVEDVWAARPNLDANPASSWGTTLNGAGDTYTKEKRQMLIDAVYKLIDQREELNPTPGSIYESNYLYDIVEFGGAVMADYAYDLLKGIKEAKGTDETLYEARKNTFLQLILDMDGFRGTNLNFRLGKWTQEARDAAAEAKTYGATIADEDWYEFNNARTILTTWGDQGQNGNGAWNNGLKDYSYRSWQGLLADYYYPRWKYYFDNDCTHPDGKAANYFYFEWNWAHGMTHQVGDTQKSKTRLEEGAKGYSYSREPVGYTVDSAKAMLKKYIIPVKYKDGSTYYAYRTFTTDLTDKITVNVADGSTANLTYYFDVPEDAIVTGDFVNNESKSAVVTEVPVKYVEGDCTASITLTDGTVLSFKVHTPLFYGVYILNHNYPSDNGGTLTSPVYVRYHDAADGYGNVGYKMVGTGGTENDRLFTIVPSDKGEGYMLSAQGKFVKSLQEWQHIMFSDDKEEAGAYVFEEAEGVFKLKGENGWYAQGWGSDLVFAGQDGNISSTFTVEKQTTYPITLSKEGYATICLPFNVILPAGVYAYDICSDMLDSENEDGILSRIAAPGDILLAGTPAVLEGGAEENILLGVTMNSVGGKTKLPNSVLHGSYTRQTLQPGGDTKKFILDGTVFSAITESKEIPANHCWVEANIEDDKIDLELIYVQIGDWKFKAIHTGKGITLTECVNYSEGHLVIGPKYVVAGVEKKVIAVADNFLHDCEHLTEVTFPYTLTSVGKSYSNFMFELHYGGPDQGFDKNIGYENPDAAEAWVGQSHDCHYKVLGASNWRMTVEVTVDKSELQHFNKYGSCLVATRENTLSNNYNDGSMQLYLRQDKGIVLKLDQTGDRYMFNNPANYANLPNGTQYEGDASTFTFTYILENDGAGGYFAKIVYGDGTEEVFELTAADNAELHDFNTIWSSLGKGIDVKVTLEKITNKGLFVGCTNLTAIHVDPLNRSFFGCDHGVLYNKSQTHIIRFPEGGGETIEDCGYPEKGHRHFETPRTVTMVYAGALHDVNAHIIFHSNPIILTVEDETDPGHAQEHMIAKYHLVLDDDSEVIDFNSANRNTFETIHYCRKVTIGEGKDFEYGTIILPFVPDAKWLANYEFYELKGWEDNSIYFSQVKQLQANVPYLYKITHEDVVMITENKKTIEPVMHYTSEVEHESGEWKSVGTYSTKSIVTNSEGEKSSYYAINAKYEFVRATRTLKTKPYRAYYLFTPNKPNATAPAKLTLRMLNGTTTEIDASQVEGMVAPEYYDLMGRRVLNPENGIYIVNGKKVVIE